MLVSADPLLAALAPSINTSTSVPPRIFTQSASSLLQRSSSQSRLLSGSPAFDSLIVSKPDDSLVGLSAGQMLELTGCPGEGKTRTCISYALQIAKQNVDKSGCQSVLVVGEPENLDRRAMPTI
jgi:hypothetical protein